MTSSSAPPRPTARRSRRIRLGPGLRRIVLLLLVAAVVGTGPLWLARPALAAPLPPGSWPLDGTPEVVRGFDPPVERWGSGHRGIDLRGAPGQPVLAAADGVVGFMGSVAGTRVVTVIHGGVRTTYLPVTGIVAVGARVVRGQPIGRLLPGHCTDGSTCLHWGLLRGENHLDPLTLVSAAPTVAAGAVRMLPADAVARARALATGRAAALAAGRGPSGVSGFLLPAAGPISSAYGMRVHPVTGVRSLHDGTDIAAPCGSPLVAPADATVVARDHHPALGERLVLDHGTVAGRRVRTALAHAESYRVAVGSRVVAGEPVGRVGSSGLSTGCHLHLMVWLDGVLVDPMTWF